MKTGRKEEVERGSNVWKDREKWRKVMAKFMGADVFLLFYVGQIQIRDNVMRRGGWVDGVVVVMG